ncbi:TonB-dependent receptor [Olivibacter domesticus]|uniref:TonB-dependent receptor n=2 Tax=Olivibacter domesticus TaxID=407022 RepID=A0A1H7Q108_OLID1|nr:TonB-dependent receptor [Olivibacter domesticus]
MAYGQQKGTVEGVVTDASLNNETMPAVSVSVQGTKQGANTDINGKFKLELNPGAHILVFSYVGYQTLRDTISVKAGNTINLNVAMASDAQMLNDVVITGEVRKDTESSLLRQQMKSAVITQSIGAQEMGRKGISNAAVAITKVTGIAKQEGTSGVFVRGLGDRYNNTLLNGLPLPSNEPTSKNISLDLFGTDVIQSIGISKIYTADGYGDVGGATVNIVSKEHVGSPDLSIEIGGGLNTNAFRSDFKKADNWNRFGFYNIKTPTTLQQYTFGSRWSPKTVNNPFNYNFAISGGKSFNVGEEGRINLFATASHTTDYTYRSGSEKIVGNRQDIVNTDFFNIQKFGYKTNTTGMLNLAYRIDSKNLIKLNSIFINGSSSTVGEYNLVKQNEPVQFKRQTLTEQNKLFLNQLLGEHQLNERLNLDWAGSYGIVNADMPDRITNTLSEDNASGYIFSTGDVNANNRYFQYITEKEWAARAALNYKLFKNADNTYNGKISVGYNGRQKKRDFEATQFSLRMNGGNTGIKGDPNDIDAFLNAGNLSSSADPNTFTLRTARSSNLTPFTYNVDLQNHGGYVNYEHTPNDRITYTLGVRVDKVLQKMTWDTNIRLPSLDFDDAKIDKLFILPEATLKYALKEDENLRVAASKSYTLPQFLEKAPFRYDDITYATIGNPYLKPADNYNLDIKWEKFPSSDELFSFGIFGKYIKDPISLSRTAAAEPSLFSFYNAGDYAYVIGAEFEARKKITDYLSGGVNLTYMYSRQELDMNKVEVETGGNHSVNFNTNHDALQGASPLLVNADLTYKATKGNLRPTFSLIGNYFYDRIFSLGAYGKGNIIERGYPTINFVSSVNIGARWDLGLKVNNILNNRIRMEQENDDAHVEVYSYKSGLDFSVGLKYNFFK